MNFNQSSDIKNNYIFINAREDISLVYTIGLYINEGRDRVTKLNFSI